MSTLSGDDGSHYYELLATFSHRAEAAIASAIEEPAPERTKTSAKPGERGVWQISHDMTEQNIRNGEIFYETELLSPDNKLKQIPEIQEWLHDHLGKGSQWQKAKKVTAEEKEQKNRMMAIIAKKLSEKSRNIRRTERELAKRGHKKWEMYETIDSTVEKGQEKAETLLGQEDELYKAMVKGVSTREILSSGLTIDDMLREGVYFVVMIERGLHPEEFLQYGYNLRQLWQGGVTILRMIAHNVRVETMLNHGIPVDAILEVAELDYATLRGKNILYNTMIKSGVSPHGLIRDIGLDTMIEDGVSLETLISNGLSLDDMVAGGIQVREILDSGVPIDLLLASGINPGELVRHGVTVDDFNVMVSG